VDLQVTASGRPKPERDTCRSSPVWVMFVVGIASQHPGQHGASGSIVSPTGVPRQAFLGFGHPSSGPHGEFWAAGVEGIETDDVYQDRSAHSPLGQRQELWLHFTYSPEKTWQRQARTFPTPGA
jgi:hypothetical protein